MACLRLEVILMFFVVVLYQAKLEVKLSPRDVGISKWDGVILSPSLPSSRICHAGKPLLATRAGF